MSQKKHKKGKKKRKNSNYYGPVITNKSYYKSGKIILIALVIIIVFVIAYMKLIGNVIYLIHTPYYFAANNPNLDPEFVSKMFGFFSLFVVAFYCVHDRKTPSKKYIKNASILILIALFITFACNCNAWVFNENTISHNSLFRKDIAVYTYDDIESVQLYHDTSARHADLIYSFKMKDGKEFKVDILEAFKEDEEMLFAFDRKISDKRETKGEYYYDFSGKSDEFNDYFRSVFDNDQ